MHKQAALPVLLRKILHLTYIMKEVNTFVIFRGEMMERDVEDDKKKSSCHMYFRDEMI